MDLGGEARGTHTKVEIPPAVRSWCQTKGYRQRAQACWRMSASRITQASTDNTLSGLRAMYPCDCVMSYRPKPQVTHHALRSGSVHPVILFQKQATVCFSLVLENAHLRGQGRCRQEQLLHLQLADAMQQAQGPDCTGLTSSCDCRWLVACLWLWTALLLMIERVAGQWMKNRSSWVHCGCVERICVASPSRWVPAARELSSPSSTSIASELSNGVLGWHMHTSAHVAIAAAGTLPVGETEVSNIMHRLGHFPAAALQ